MSLSRPFALLTVLVLLTACTQAGATAVPATPTVAPPSASAAPRRQQRRPRRPQPPRDSYGRGTGDRRGNSHRRGTDDGASHRTACDGHGRGDLPPIAVVCDPTTLNLKNPGRLTLSTDLPAFPPWWGGDAAEQYPNEPEGGSSLERDATSAPSPTRWKGSKAPRPTPSPRRWAFSPTRSTGWPTQVFAQAFAPGEKPFDFHMAQIAITEKRAKNVTFSDSVFRLQPVSHWL